MPHHDDPFAPAVQTARDWVRAVADGLETDDRAFAYRALRAWLHTVRDRIGVAASAHLTAQLPELLRGVYYEGWVPSHVPVRHRTAEFITQFAREADIARDEVGPVAGAVTTELSQLFSPGQLNRVFATLPMHLYGILCGARLTPDEDPLEQQPATDRLEVDRLTSLEYRVQALGDAVAVLTRGLELLPIDASDDTRTTSAAQQAHRILLAEGLVGADPYGRER
ncbi:DUF2267 domain-containing protein [Nocardia sp. NBC_01730]|uniref:DUF2267 domain-containing protein n=1 Tax=Nocardia sp. NBC_01730 TaxID=2975998 RepID=UPI002E0EEB3B|nr:DUF2267 domain-containing protein [Nocardia sp. NBC_01730]